MDGPNYFQSQIFIKKIKDVEKDAILNIGNKLKCSICKKNLKNPMNDPKCCQHFGCENCFINYFKSQKKNILPCKICKKMIKKVNLTKSKAISSIMDKLKMNNENKDELLNKIIEQKCNIHPKNTVFFFCLDCQKQMCPTCEEEMKNHNNHHLINYERYMSLFKIFQDNYQSLKNIINEKENDIKEYINLILFFDQQKNAFTTFFNDFIAKIDDIYSKYQEKLNTIIEESKQTIVKLRDFMKNLKIDISSRFKKEYNDVENFDALEAEIKDKIGKLEIKEINKKEILDIKNKYTNNNIYELSKKEIITTLNKKKLFDNCHLNNKIDEKGNYSFGIELSEDKTTIKTYLDIDKYIDNKKNESCYIAFIEYGKKKKIIYLEPTEVIDNKYSFENTLPIEKIFKENNSVDIKLTILYLTI